MTRLALRVAGTYAGVGEWVPGSWIRASTAEPWTVLAQCDALITASGTSTWEAAAVGVPVVLLKLAVNQDLVFAWGRSMGVPGVDALEIPNADVLADALAAALPHARPLPNLRSGADWVAGTLQAMLAAVTRSR